jgi:hypothetical protein
VVVRGIEEPAPYGAGFPYVNPYVKSYVISGFNAIISSFIPVKIVGAKNLENRMNKRKSRNHKGYGISFSLVELRGVEPLKIGLKPA